MTSNSLSFSNGLHGQAAYFGAGSLLEFNGQPGLPTQSGTIEFWTKPNWSSDAPTDRDFVWWGGNYGGFYLRYWGGYLLATFNAGTPQNWTLWAPHEGKFVWNSWNHIAITWNTSVVKIYLNGKILRDFPPEHPFSAPSSGMLRIGGSANSGPVAALIDEFRLSNTARTAADIKNGYVSGFMPATDAIRIRLPTLNFYRDWHLMPRLEARIGTQWFADVPISNAQWVSSDTNVAVVRSDGRIQSNRPGSATITATCGDKSHSVGISVTTPVLPPVLETIDPFLAAPAENSEKVIPIVILRFLPTRDGVMLDDRSIPDFWSLNPVSLDVMEGRLLEFDRRVKFALEEGSKFRGYKRPDAKPYFGYKVLAHITVYEPTPPGFSGIFSKGYEIFYHDFYSIFERFDLTRYINELGVSEVWLWEGFVYPEFPSFDPNYSIAEHARCLWESNMSSPSGDVSNSNRDNSDLPVLNKTYIVYSQNMRRSQAEAIHNRGHQFEAMLQHLNTSFFWEKFVGMKPGTFEFSKGRAGWTHMPPNTTNNYETTSSALVESDIEDWRPDNSGQKKLVNVSTWANINYAWPGAKSFEQKDETQWYVYWFQNFPGQGNNIPYEADKKVSNWWEIIADWDKATQNKLNLYEPKPNPDTAALTDGLPNSWWIQYFGTTEGVSAAADSDGDGFSNAQEHALGTDPKSFASALRTDPPAFSSGQVTISWNAVGGKTYRVRGATNLATTNWSTLEGYIIGVSLGGNITMPTTGKVTWTHSTGSAQHFYRVELVQ